MSVAYSAGTATASPPAPALKKTSSEAATGLMVLRGLVAAVSAGRRRKIQPQQKPHPKLRNPYLPRISEEAALRP